MKSDTEIYALLADADPVADPAALDTSALTARMESALGRGLATSPADLTRKETTMVTRQQPDLETRAPTPTPPPRTRRGPLIAAATAVVIILAGVGLAFAAGVFDSESDTTAADELTTTVPTTISADPQVAEVADGTIGTYPPGRYRVDQLSPATRFTIEDEWSISDFAAPDDQGGFSGLRPEELAAADAEDPFVSIWGPITAWYDIATETHVVFPPGELAARVEADPRLTDVAVTQVTVGDYPAIRIGANVLDEYQTGNFWLGAGYPREDGDIDWYLGNVISDAGDAAEHVVFWVIDIDGDEMLVNATYPTELADEFEPILEALVASIEFE